MKKIFKALLVFCAVFCVMPVFACSQITGSMTGGACSIKELNNFEKSKNVQEKVSLEFKRERNLRPVRYNQYIQKPNDDCLFGMCIQKILLGR